MYWYKDEWDDAYDDIVYDNEYDVDEEEEEYDESAMYFDVPLPYRPIQLTKDKPLWRTRIMNEVVKKEEKNTLTTVQETRELCTMLMKTPHYQKMGADGIFAIVQKARAIGIDPLDALNGGMYFVQGKVELTSTMMNDLIRRQGHSITKDKKSDDKICILHGRRADNGDTWSESFSIEDAKTAGIYRNQWLKYPKDMLFARALSRLARQLFPDVIKGCYVDGEMQQAVGIDKQPAAEEALPISLEELKDAIENNIDVPHKEHLYEYLKFVEERVNKPLREVLDSWLSNPDPFKSHYQKWVSKKLVESNVEVQYEDEREPSLFEEHA